MEIIVSGWSATCASVVFVGWAATTRAMQEGGREIRPAAELLREYDSVRYPSFSDGSDPESVAKFEREIRDAATRQQRLALELAESHPDHERTDDVLGSRWTLLCTVNRDGGRVLQETEEWVRRLPRPEIAKAAAGARSIAAITIPELEFSRRREVVLAALETAPDSVQVGVVLTELAWRFTADPVAQVELAALAREHFAGDDDVSHGLVLVERLAARVGSRSSSSSPAARPIARTAPRSRSAKGAVGPVS
jgi:hypothetical protein